MLVKAGLERKTVGGDKHTYGKTIVRDRSEVPAVLEARELLELVAIEARREAQQTVDGDVVQEAMPDDADVDAGANREPGVDPAGNRNGRLS
jgi:hypothetical protein